MLNAKSYAFHYRSLDSTLTYARKALSLASHYSTGKAEAYNNMAFAHIATMDYKRAYAFLDSVYATTDNQIELLIADIQLMRLCQRESRNKNFYDYNQKASQRLKRIDEETAGLSDREHRRLIYARSEFAIVASTYYYYVGLNHQSVDALKMIDPYGEIQKDTAQYLNYLYQVGSGGIITAKYKDEIAQKEFEHLFKCYAISRKSGLVYWEANALQSISEHLLVGEQRDRLTRDNMSEIKYINSDNMPFELLSGNLAQRSLELFRQYGDAYQVAGAYRTLSYCYWELGDYSSALICLEHSLEDNKIISQAPDLVASIRERLSLVYAAIDDKNNSDINRNLYLDLQDKTRQDRQLEARAEQLEHISTQLNILIISILILIVILALLLPVFRQITLRKGRKYDMGTLLKPLEEWKAHNRKETNRMVETSEDLDEQLSIARLRIDNSKKRNLDNRAKVFLVNNVLPYIDRIVNEATRLSHDDETPDRQQERQTYIAELTDKIGDFNKVLTHWIQLQQGQLRLHIESFCIDDVLEVVARAEMSFKMKGVKLTVDKSGLMVKADKILTLFMLNTLADNARKFTEKGGEVHVYAEALPDCVEISVKDNGKGLTKEEQTDIFERKISNGHGFGLMNCRGIMDKYHKTSRIFNVCGLFVESSKGAGSRFFFRLPYGLTRLLAMVFCITAILSHTDARMNSRYDNNKNDNIATQYSDLLKTAGRYADSAYYSNINGTFEKTIAFTDSARHYLNLHYKQLYPKGTRTMVKDDNQLGVPAEIRWFHEGVKTDYDIILDIRNEGAVAALALHDWELYRYNNMVYTRLFKENSADRTLSDYCATMQKSSTNKTIAIVILLILLCIIICSWYFLYYKKVVFFRLCLESVDNINAMLLSGITDGEKLSRINAIDTTGFPARITSVIDQVRTALEQSIHKNAMLQTDIDIKRDELRRISYEDERLYISNNVIDNCLSTLKHETMYYPSRIRQLIDNDRHDFTAIKELVAYYKELYGILCEQVQRQVDMAAFDCRKVEIPLADNDRAFVMGDATLINYLIDIIKRHCGVIQQEITETEKDGKYIVINAPCHDKGLTPERCASLFEPAIGNLPFLICRQIVREISEMTNLHGCGITTDTDGENGETVIHIILPKAPATETIISTTNISQ
ncbi:MAG: DUF5112 domain-containing protein [Prevotella sp.]